MATPSKAKALKPQEERGLVEILRARFEENPARHEGVEWGTIHKRLEAQPRMLSVLAEMERTGGEPDVVRLNKALAFVDCSPESPDGRRSVCYDREGLESRKEHRPKTSAVDLAAEIGIELLTEEEYFALQQLGEFDLKTSGWIATPADIRSRGGALYAERRYDRVFIGHNGAQSYYAVRGFRGRLLL